MGAMGDGFRHCLSKGSNTMTRKEAVKAYMHGTSGSLLVGFYSPAAHFDLWTFTEIYRVGIFFLGAFLLLHGSLWFFKNMDALWISD
jgi:hypothetical protein